jgi:hypothetical protein
MGALGVKDIAAYRHSFRRRRVDLITALTNRGYDGKTFELRIISHPDRDVPARGAIDVFLLARLNESNDADAAGFANELIEMLSANFAEFEFDLASAEEVESALKPFPVRKAYSIRRRVAMERLDTLRSSVSQEVRSVGFGKPTSKQARESSVPDGSVLHLFPFVQSEPAFGNVFRHLLLADQPAAISISVQPGALTEDESVFLEEGMAACERYGQVGLSAIAGDDLSGLYPTLRQKASAHQHHLSRFLFGLRDNAAVMTINVLSAGDLSPFIPEAVAGLISGPAGTSDDGRVAALEDYLAGGYEIVALDPARAGEASECLDLTMPSYDLAPTVAQRLPYLFDSFEASVVLLLPPASVEPLAGVDVRNWRPAPPPRSLPMTGVLLGTTVEPGIPREVRISREDRLRHVYTVGQTGTGKSSLLKTMILDDIRSGAGVCVLDPHGDLYKDLLGRIPDDRVNDVVLIDPTDIDYPVSINLLEYETPFQRHFIIQEFSSIISRMMTDVSGDAAREWLGPIFFQHVRMNLLLVMSNPHRQGTLLDFYNIFQEENFWKTLVPGIVSDPMLKRWIENVLPRTDYLKSTGEGVSMGSWISSKFEGFVFDPMLRNIFSRRKSTIDIAEAMNTGKIVLVNLAKGELTETNSRFLGMIVLAKIQAGAMRRSRTPEAERRPFYVYVDEFQSIATEGFVTLLSEGRKFGLGLVLANQFVSQIKNEKIMASIFGNVGTLVCMRLGEADAEQMEREMAPTLSRSDLLDIPNWHAYVSTLVDNQTVRPFEMRTVLDPELFNKDRAAEVVALSRSRYGPPQLTADLS